MSQELDELSLDELRRRRDAVHAREESVSYRRRLLHAQLDIVEASATATDPEELAFRLGRVLSDPPSTAAGPARSVDVDDSPPDVDVPALPSDLLGLDETARADLLRRLRDDERAASDERRRLLAELDALQAAIVLRFQRDGVDARALLEDAER